MAVKCKNCGAFMQCKKNEYKISFWECLSCHRHVSIPYGEIKNKNEDEFI